MSDPGVPPPRRPDEMSAGSREFLRGFRSAGVGAALTLVVIAGAALGVQASDEVLGYRQPFDFQIAARLAAAAAFVCPPAQAWVYRACGFRRAAGGALLAWVVATLSAVALLVFANNAL